MRWIIRQEKAKGLTIPAEPDLSVPQRVSVATLGTQINLVGSLDEKYLSGKDKLREK